MPKEVVIIGSGLGGLVSGALLSRAGYHVTVLERQRVAGGCLQCFTRNGERFETGMHFVGGVAEGEILDRFLTLCGIKGRVAFTPLSAAAQSVITLDDKEYRIAAGREAFAETLGADIGCGTAMLTRFFDLNRSVARASSLYTPAADDATLMASKYHTLSIGDVMDEMGLPKKVQNVLGGDLSLYAGVRNRTPFSAMAFLKDFYSDGAYRFTGGSDTLVRALTEVITANGGRVLTSCEVTAVHCDATGVTSVTAGTERFLADYLFSDIHPTVLMPMIESTRLRPAYRKRIDALQNTTSCFTVYITFKPGTMPYAPTNYYGYPGASPWGSEQSRGDAWPGGYLYMHNLPDAADGFAGGAQIISYMDFDEVAQWASTYVGKRSDSYNEFKRQRAARLIDLVDRHHPGLKESIAAINVSTPLTYRDYNATPGGSMYGVSKDLTLGPANRVSHRTHIPNLFLVGQNINSHGMLGVLVGALVACSEMPGLHDLFRRL